MEDRTQTVEGYLEQAVSTLIQKPGVFPSIEDREKNDGFPWRPEIDLESSTISVDLNNLKDDELRFYSEIWTEVYSERAMQDVLNNRIRFLENELDIEVENPSAVFLPLETGGSGFYDKDEHRVGVDRSNFPHVQLGEPIQVIWPGTNRTLSHESVHAAQMMTDRFEELHSDIAEKDVYNQEFTDNVDRAGMEALARFEEDPWGNHMQRGRELEKGLSKVYRLPGLLEKDRGPEGTERKRLNGGGGFQLGDHLYSDPYGMADVIAYSVKNYFKTRDDIENHRRETRKALFDIAADAEEWERMLSGIWKELGYPDYHKIFEENYRRIQNDPVYAKNELNRLKQEVREKEKVEPEEYYEVRSFIHAYEETGRNAPDQLMNLARDLYDLEKIR